MGAPHARRRGQRSRTASSRPTYARLEPLAGWILRQNGRAVPLEPPELRDAVADGLRKLRERHTGDPRRRSRASAVDDGSPAGPDRPVGPVAPERFGVLQSLLAHLLAACGDGAQAALDADELADRFRIPREELQEHLSLLNLVNFGGGCYTVYAEVDEDDGTRPRRQGALRRRLPAAAEADAARGARDQARDRVRRADDRGRGAHAARPRAAGSSRRRSASSSSRRRRSRAIASDEEKLVRRCSATAPTSAASSRSST